ncbi:MAG TPA: HlyD family efflux transporter periplasmic adaptor subunit, partial [Pirellulaceae bacterium]|nr:HlyD family efflux transporter periplasmic adaptor subunit [Pirellulaceae bacterium]
MLSVFGGLLAYAARDQWMPFHEVTVVPVLTARGTSQREGTPLFQAAGWVEPRPSPVQAAALAEGIVAEVLVVDGQEVEQGEPIARLIDTDARLALRRAKVLADVRRAELHSATADLTAARQRLEFPVHLQAELAEAQSILAKSESERAKLPFLIEAAEAQATLAAEVLATREAARDSVAGMLVRQARSERDMAVAHLNELQQRGSLLETELAALRARVAALNSKLELRIEEQRAVAEAESKEAAARARLIEADLAVEHAELVVERMTVRAPISGKILQRMAQPGTSLIGLDPSGGHSSSTVATMYDPHQLQIRADVRLEDFPLVVPGQRVLVETASLRQPLQGIVLQTTSSANIQKNTVEVKVALVDPPAVIRPEMLVTATFLAPLATEGDPTDEEPMLRILAPRDLIEGSGDQAQVWVVGDRQRAELRPIRLGSVVTPGWIEVVSGLNPTDKIIASGRERLTAGARLRVSHKSEEH